MIFCRTDLVDASGLEHKASSGDSGIGERASRRKWNTRRFPRRKGQYLPHIEFKEFVVEACIVIVRVIVM